jgi:hypothetical protein
VFSGSFDEIRVRFTGICEQIPFMIMHGFPDLGACALFLVFAIPFSLPTPSFPYHGKEGGEKEIM